MGFESEKCKIVNFRTDALILVELVKKEIIIVLLTWNPVSGRNHLASLLELSVGIRSRYMLLILKAALYEL